jgi:hypothetical protein
MAGAPSIMKKAQIAAMAKLYMRVRVRSSISLIVIAYVGVKLKIRRRAMIPIIPTDRCSTTILNLFRKYCDINFLMDVVNGVFEK